MVRYLLKELRFANYFNYFINVERDSFIIWSNQKFYFPPYFKGKPVFPILNTNHSIETIQYLAMQFIVFFPFQFYFAKISIIISLFLGFVMFSVSIQLRSKWYFMFRRKPVRWIFSKQLLHIESNDSLNLKF